MSISIGVTQRNGGRGNTSCIDQLSETSTTREPTVNTIILQNRRLDKMLSSQVPEDDREQADLLLETSETLIQMSEISLADQLNDEANVFFSHLGSACLRLREHARRARHSLQPLTGQLISETLQQFDFLLSRSSLKEIARSISTMEYRLGVINLQWKEIRKHHGKAEGARVSYSLVLGMPSNTLAEISDALETCADAFDKHHPGNFSEADIGKPKPLAVNQPSLLVWQTAQSVFDALSDCKECSCPNDHEFGAKMGLGTFRRRESKVKENPAGKGLQARQRQLRREQDDSIHLNFDVFLHMEKHWNEVCIQTIKDKTVTILLPGEVIPPRKERSAAIGQERVETLCGPLSRTRTASRQRLVLRLINGQLFGVRCENISFEINQTSEAFSLSRVLEERKGSFTEKIQRILLLIIGYTVLHLSGTSWLQPGWGSANIKFFQTTSRKTPLRPFIQTKLPTTGEREVLPNENTREDTFNEPVDMHRCPELVTLAVVLMEIYFVTPFRKLARMRNIPLMDGSAGSTTRNMIDVDQVFNGIKNDDDEVVTEGWRSQIPDDNPLRVAIDNCLDPELWEDEEGRALDSQTLRQQIYQNVVSHLELYLSRGFGTKILDNVDKYARDLDFENWGQAIDREERDYKVILTPSDAPVAPAFDVIRPHTSEVHICNTTSSLSRIQLRPRCFVENQAGVGILNVDDTELQFFDDEMKDKKKNYENWKNEYHRVYSRVIDNDRFRRQGEPAVKIAVLDTGIDSSHDLISGCDYRIKGKWDFSQPGRTVQDFNGHGTFTASLILSYAPHADLYVFKILDHENARPDAEAVANAIDYAINMLDIDIISMSFGWPSSDFTGHSILEAAIDRAYSKNVLMFAAAANSGGRLGRAYPASYSHVICVHSTNTNGDRSSFSPTPEPEKANFATVGECIESAWPEHLCDDVESGQGHVTTRSGTSYATAILSGIAAFLLQYAKLYLTAHEVAALRRKVKMEALLKRCAEKGQSPSKRDGYYFVTLSLHKQALFGEDAEWVKHEILRAMK